MKLLTVKPEPGQTLSAKDLINELDASVTPILRALCDCPEENDETVNIKEGISSILGWLEQIKTFFWDHNLIAEQIQTQKTENPFPG